MQRRLLSLALAFSLAAITLPAAPASAVVPLVAPLSLSAAVKSLQAYNVIDRLPESELRLDQTITRAEMAKVLGAALKLHSSAEAKRTTPSPFPDVEGHWAAGWINLSRERGLFLGRDDGRFHPQDPVTHAEVLTVLLRLTGRGPQAAFNWPWGAVAMAAEYGMIPADMNLGGQMLEPATRANVFRLTALGIGRIFLSGSAETLLQSLGDRTPPALELVRVPTVTGDARPNVAGRAPEAVTVYVGDTPVDLQPDGTFAAPVQLRQGENPITFTAIDGAGNRAEKKASILLQSSFRIAFTPAMIETSMGQPFTPTVLRYDSDGRSAVADAIAWAYDPAALTFDAKTGSFTAAKAGEYLLTATVEGVSHTARVIVAGEPAQLAVTTPLPTMVAGGAPVPVTVRVLDSAGRLVTAGSQQVQFATLPASGGTFDTPMVATARGTGIAYLSPGKTTGGIGIQATVLGATKLISPVVPVNLEARRVAGVQLATDPPNVRPLMGQTVNIIATAVDQVGIPIAVREDLPITLTASGSNILTLSRNTATIRAGTSSSDLSGSNGVALTSAYAGTVTVSGYQAGGFSATPATFRSVAAGPLAALDVRVVREAAAADKLSAALVAVTRVDQQGNPVAGDSTPVVLYSTVGSANISLVSDSGGVALFAIRSATGGRVELAAGLPGRPEMNSKPVKVAFVQSTNTARPAIKTSATSVTAGGTISAYVALESSGGQLLANPGPALKFVLEAPGATLSAAELVIPTGATGSAGTVISIPATANLVSLTGRMIGGDALPPATISVVPVPPAPPAPAPTGLNMVAAPVPTGRPPAAGEEAKFQVTVRNGLSVQQGSHAFGVRVLVGGQEVTAPIPGLTIKAGPRTLDPGAVMRTTAGQAEIWVRYTGAGSIEIQPVPAPQTETAPDHFGVAGPAEATMNYRPTGGRVSFTAGPLHHMDVAVSPNLGDLAGGVIKAARGRFATVRLSPVDAYGNPTGQNCLATLTQLRAAPAGALVLRAAAADVTEQSITVGASGRAEFIIVANTDGEATSEWSPMIMCGSTPLTAAKNITVSATVHAAPTPVIEYVAGSNSNVGELKTGDQGLDLRIAQLKDAPASAELLVYEGNLLIGRFGPVSGASPLTADRTVRLPTALFAGMDRSITLRVRIHSGAEVSEESAPVYVYYHD